MRFECTEERLSDQDQEAERHYLLTKGDVVTVPDKLGERWCAHGWGKDLDGHVETGERVVRGAAVAPKNATHNTKTKTKAS